MTGAETDWLAEGFERHRPRLTAVASRMLGSRHDAEDAVQETWLRFSRSDTAGIADLGSWLTTVATRVCLNGLQSRRTRRELSLESDVTDSSPSSDRSTDPEAEALLADSIGAAMLIVLDRLTPAERVAFVLHDTFAVPFDDIADILGRSRTAVRQLASRARRRVRAMGAAGDADGIAHSRLVDAFLTAARRADFAGLLAVLDPDVTLTADQQAVKMGGPESRGAGAVASWFSGRAGGARHAVVNGRAGAVWMPGGQLRVVFNFVCHGDRIVAIELVADRERIRQMDVVVPAQR